MRKRLVLRIAAVCLGNLSSKVTGFALLMCSSRFDYYSRLAGTRRTVLGAHWPRRIWPSRVETLGHNLLLCRVSGVALRAPLCTYVGVDTVLCCGVGEKVVLILVLKSVQGQKWEGPSLSTSRRSRHRCRSIRIYRTVRPVACSHESGCESVQQRPWDC